MADIRSRVGLFHKSKSALSSVVTRDESAHDYIRWSKKFICCFPVHVQHHNRVQALCRHRSMQISLNSAHCREAALSRHYTLASRAAETDTLRSIARQCLCQTTAAFPAAQAHYSHSPHLSRCPSKERATVLVSRGRDQHRSSHSITDGPCHHLSKQEEYFIVASYWWCADCTSWKLELWSLSSVRLFQVENCNISCISLRWTLEKIPIFARKVGGPEIGPAHKEQKVGGPRPARPNRLRRQWFK